MSETEVRIRELTLLQGILEAVRGRESVEEILAATKDPGQIKFGPEIRSARLYTEISVNDKKFSFDAVGARGCGVTGSEVVNARGTLVFNLTCDLTYFAADDTPLGPIRIVQDPRIQTKGWIHLRRNQEGKYELPGLSYFNQHLIFHIGDRFFYYPRAWQVVSAITTWPPEYHQYHHLEPDTPIFDFLTGEPNVARKGISTISIEGSLTADEEKRVRTEYEKEIEVINALPASKMGPENLTPLQE